VPDGRDGARFNAVIDPIAVRLSATPQQIALAWQLQSTLKFLPIPGTRSIEHLRENLAAVALRLTEADVDAITESSAEGNSREAS
jgi:aryl-alcohol dehydrogenase-like predicted oxidoreductase